MGAQDYEPRQRDSEYRDHYGDYRHSERGAGLGPSYQDRSRERDDFDRGRDRDLDRGRGRDDRQREKDRAQREGRDRDLRSGYKRKDERKIQPQRQYRQKESQKKKAMRRSFSGSHSRSRSRDRKKGGRSRSRSRDRSRSRSPRRDHRRRYSRSRSSSASKSRSPPATKPKSKRPSRFSSPPKVPLVVTTMETSATKPKPKRPSRFSSPPKVPLVVTTMETTKTPVADVKKEVETKEKDEEKKPVGVIRGAKRKEAMKEAMRKQLAEKKARAKAEAEAIVAQRLRPKGQAASIRAEGVAAHGGKSFANQLIAEKLRAGKAEYAGPGALEAPPTPVVETTPEEPVSKPKEQQQPEDQLGKKAEDEDVDGVPLTVEEDEVDFEEDDVDGEPLEEDVGETSIASEGNEDWSVGWSEEGEQTPSWDQQEPSSTDQEKSPTITVGAGTKEDLQSEPEPDPAPEPEPQENVEEDEQGIRLYINPVVDDVENDDLIKLFQGFGRVTQLIRMPGFCFIDLQEAQGGKAACKALHNTPVFQKFLTSSEGKQTVEVFSASDEFYEEKMREQEEKEAALADGENRENIEGDPSKKNSSPRTKSKSDSRSGEASKAAGQKAADKSVPETAATKKRAPSKEQTTKQSRDRLSSRGEVAGAKKRTRDTRQLDLEPARKKFSRIESDVHRPGDRSTRPRSPGFRANERSNPHMNQRDTDRFDLRDRLPLDRFDGPPPVTGRDDRPLHMRGPPMGDGRGPLLGDPRGPQRPFLDHREMPEPRFQEPMGHPLDRRGPPSPRGVIERGNRFPRDQPDFHLESRGLPRMAGPPFDRDGPPPDHLLPREMLPPQRDVLPQREMPPHRDMPPGQGVQGNFRRLHSTNSRRVQVRAKEPPRRQPIVRASAAVRASRARPIIRGGKVINKGGRGSGTRRSSVIHRPIIRGGKVAGRGRAKGPARVIVSGGSKGPKRRGALKKGVPDDTSFEVKSFDEIMKAKNK